MTIKIENYREQPPGTYLVALFDIYLPNTQLTIRQLKLCVSKRGVHFLGFPSFSSDEMDHEGKKIWTPYFSFSKEYEKKFEQSVFDAIGPFVKGPINRGFKN